MRYYLVCVSKKNHLECTSVFRFPFSKMLWLPNKNKNSCHNKVIHSLQKKSKDYLAPPKSELDQHVHRSLMSIPSNVSSTHLVDEILVQINGCKLKQNSEKIQYKSWYRKLEKNYVANSRVLKTLPGRCWLE